MVLTPLYITLYAPCMLKDEGFQVSVMCIVTEVRVANSLGIYDATVIYRMEKNDSIYFQAPFENIAPC